MRHKTSEKELEIYYDHYKDSFSHQILYIKQRDKYFFYCVIVLALLFLNSILPRDFEIFSKLIIENKIGFDKFSNFELIDSILLFCILSIIIKYFQVNLLIERQYTYIHNIEKTISIKLEDFNISREGKEYLNHYPFFSSIIHGIYTIGFPFLLIILVVINWCENLSHTANFGLFSFFLFDTVITIIIVILTVFYLIWIHFKDFRNSKSKENKDKKK